MMFLSPTVLLLALFVGAILNLGLNIVLHQRQQNDRGAGARAGPVVQFLDNFASPSSRERGNASNKKYDPRGTIRKRKAVMPSSVHKDYGEKTHEHEKENNEINTDVVAATDIDTGTGPTDEKREQLREKLSVLFRKYKKHQVQRPAVAPARAKKQTQQLKSEVAPAAANRVEMGPVTAINIIGERHSGTDWIADHLIDCFGDQILVESNFTRHKHWFQVNDSDMSSSSAIVLAMFRDPYDWINDMREHPINAHHHIGMEWNEFVSTPWTGPRGRGDRKVCLGTIDVIDITDYFDGCIEGFEYNEVIPCNVQDSLPSDKFGNYMYELDPDQEPVLSDSDNGYPCTYDGVPYESIIHLRTAKIRNFVAVRNFDGVKDYFPHRYETLKLTGTAKLLKQLEDSTGITAQCIPLDGAEEDSVNHDPEYVEWMNANLDWDVEAMVGYTNRYAIPQRDKSLKSLKVSLEGKPLVIKQKPEPGPRICLNSDFRPANTKSVWSMMILSDKDDDEMREGYREGFLSSAAKLGHSVLANVHDVSIDLIMMELKEKPLPKETWDVLYAVGWQRCTVERIAPLDEEETKPRFRDQFTKFRLWGMTMYESILYLDSDTLVMNSIDDLLQTDLRKRNKLIGVTRDYRDESWMPTFNMGVFLIHPSTEEYQRLLQTQVNPSFRYSKLMSEQGFLNELYWNHWHDIGFGYNANTCVFEEDRSFWDEHEDDIRVVHYTCTKPWRQRLYMCSPNNDIPCHWWNTFKPLHYQ